MPPQTRNIDSPVKVRFYPGSRANTGLPGRSWGLRQKIICTDAARIGSRYAAAIFREAIISISLLTLAQVVSCTLRTRRE
jgi:hypothetical protein